MNKFFIAFIFSTILISHAATSQNKILIGGGGDIYKTDNIKLFNKFQFGMELNYFVLKKATLSGGMEIWTDPELTFLTLGARVYPLKPLYLRGRILTTKTLEFSIGSGYNYAITKNLWFDFSGDYYFEAGDFAIRTGLCFGF